MVNTTLIFAGGPTPNAATLKLVQAITNVDLIIAADSGLHTAQKLNLKVDVAIGDMDSVDESALAQATRNGTQIIRHSSDKDFTDLHSALLHAAEQKPTKIVVVTGGGGRLDHQFGVVAAMFNPALRNIAVEAVWDDSYIYALQGPTKREFSVQVGDTVGLQSFSDLTTKITTTGLRWSLTNESLSNFETRGVSNEATAPQVSIAIETGALLAIHELKQHDKQQLTQQVTVQKAKL